MPTPLQPELDALATSLLDPAGLIRAVAAGRRRAQHPTWRRAELRPVDLKSGRVLQVVTYDERQAHTANHPYGAEAAAAVAALLAEPFGNWHVESTDATVELRVTKKGDAQVHRTPAPRPTAASPADHPHQGAPASSLSSSVRPDASTRRAHDRTKPRLLDPAHPVMRALGLSDRSGAIKPSRQAKYRQVEDFLRQVDAVLPAPGAADEWRARTLEVSLGRPDAERRGGERLRIVDLGCGNAYLTFGVYAYLTDVLGREVDLVGVDVREQARERNTAIAAELGWSEHVRFVAAPIDEVELDVRPDIVLALHACDTATDDALVRAVRWEAPIVLAAPCCHHDLQRRIAAAGAPRPWGLVTRHGLLRERLADVLTDALRAALLRRVGYRVDVVEFVDSAHTPRNAMLRAVRTGAAPGSDVERDYAELTAQWGITPYLEEALRGRGVRLPERQV